jgi:hypothetical protein
MFVNLGNNLTKIYSERPRDHYKPDDVFADAAGGNMTVTSTLMGSKQWIVVPIPPAYSGTNWPIRVSGRLPQDRELARGTLGNGTGLKETKSATDMVAKLTFNIE